MLTKTTAIKLTLTVNLSFYEITVTFEIYTSQLVIYKILVKRTQLWNIYEVNFMSKSASDIP